MSLLSFLIRRNELPRKHERYRFRPRLEVLEGRALPSTLVVHNPNDAGLGSLRQTIHDAASGDKIIFDHALAGETITLTSELLITRSLQIQGFDFGRVDGSPVVINGNGASRVFDIFVSTADVTLFGLIITGGFAGTAIGDNGGGILTSGTLTVSHCTLSGNAGNYGGGIYNNHGALTVSHSTLSGNKAAFGGGIYNKDGTLTVSHCEISSNAAIGGGGITNMGRMIITHSTLSKNSAFINAGGIASTNADGIAGGVTISQSTLSDNSCGDAGGGILVADDNLAISDSTLSGNSAGRGGGIFVVSSGSLTIRDSTLSGNSAHAPPDTSRSGTGGGIFFDFDARGTLSNCVLSDNSASAAGGGIFAGDFADPATPPRVLTHCKLSNNSAGLFGGGIYNGSAILIVDHSALSRNSAKFGGGIANGVGASVMTGTGGAIAITHSLLALNSASEAGGGIFNGTGSRLNVVDHSDIVANSAPVGADLFNLGSLTKDTSSTILIIGP